MKYTTTLLFALTATTSLAAPITNPASIEVNIQVQLSAVEAQETLMRFAPVHAGEEGASRLHYSPVHAGNEEETRLHYSPVHAGEEGQSREK
ncbi:uncharacterized protein LY89DRAFT_789581 [Mollisia scopiformis]|uniref:Uncharacterized protein n=1 Tax=Mollisia scopiformis TaxID=149040 RepID=A0A132B503_MOLSC|nr:uncharacterized protein LY89DRAFT_789581 [Mollisia scopiformis]KUJ07482.1 hypothetical protein LY89DRAFT_789581 [Mollisia scopiformis]